MYDSRKYCVWQVIAVALPVMKRFEPYKKCIQNCLKPYSTLKNIKILWYAFNWRVKKEVRDTSGLSIL